MDGLRCDRICRGLRWPIIPPNPYDLTDQCDAVVDLDLAGRGLWSAKARKAASRMPFGTTKAPRACLWTVKCVS